MKENVILVNEFDEMCGTMDKLEAHLSGKLHRALSVFIFNTRGELLLQHRAFEKYHSGGVWSNTCCSHPRPDENVADAANRRLQEEMGMSCVLSFAFDFLYRVTLSNGLIEHEFDHVFMGVSDVLPIINPAEVAGFNYMAMAELGRELQEHPENYSEWLNICFPQIMKHHVKLFN